MEPCNLADYEITKKCLNWFAVKNESANVLKSGALHLGGAVATLLSSATEAVLQTATVMLKIVPAIFLSFGNLIGRCCGRSDFNSIKKYGLKAVGKHCYQAIKYTFGTFVIPFATFASFEFAQNLIGKPSDPMKKGSPPPPPPAGAPKPKIQVQNKQNADKTAETAKPVETKVEPTPAPKVEPTPAPKVEPTPAPKVEPTPAPKVEPTPAPKVEPTPAPKVEPTPAPKVEPTPAPKAEPTPAPKVEPTVAPKAKSDVPEPAAIATPKSPVPSMPRGTPPPPPTGTVKANFRTRTPPAEAKPETPPAKNDSVKKRPSQAPNSFASFAELAAAKRKSANEAAEAEAEEKAKLAYEKKEAEDKEKAALAQAEKAKKPEPLKRELSRGPASGANTPRISVRPAAQSNDMMAELAAKLNRNKASRESLGEAPQG